VVKDDRVVFVDLHEADGLLGEFCSRGWFPYIHELEMAEAGIKLPEKPLVPPPPPDHGMALLADPAGLRVDSIAPGGRGEAAGVKPGMVITRINNVSLVGVGEVIAKQIVGNLSLEDTVRLEMTDRTVITLVKP